MQMKKHFLAAALALGVGVGATSALPAADIQPPTAQVGFVPLISALPTWVTLFFWKDGAGCRPYDLDVRCASIPGLPGHTPAVPGDPSG